MESHFNFPMPLTIRCFKCGKVFEVALTSEERHEFSCPGCGEIEVCDLGAMIVKVADREDCPRGIAEAGRG